MRTPLARFALALTITGSSALAHAQSEPVAASQATPEPPPQVIAAESAAPQSQAPSSAVEITLPQRTAVDPAIVQQEALRELARAQARGSLSIFVSPDNQLTVRWRDEQGREIARSVPAPNDPFEFVRTVGVLVANLANDQLQSLLPPQVVLSPPPVVIHLHQSSATPPMPSQPVVQPPAAQPPAAQPVDWRAQRARQRVSFGFDGYLSYWHESYMSSSFSRTSSAVGSIGGLFVNGHINPWLRLGAQQIMGGGLPTGGGFYVGAAPYVEALASPWRWLELYGQLGVGAQYQRGGLSSLAIAPTVTAGARFRLGDVFSISVGARGTYSAVGAFVHGAFAASEGSFYGGGGIELAWTVGG